MTEKKKQPVVILGAHHPAPEAAKSAAKTAYQEGQTFLRSCGFRDEPTPTTTSKPNQQS